MFGFLELSEIYLKFSKTTNQLGAIKWFPKIFPWLQRTPTLLGTFFLRLYRMRNDDYGYRMQPIARCTVSCCRMKVYLWHFCFSPLLSSPTRTPTIFQTWLGRSIFWICKIVQSFLSALALSPLHRSLMPPSGTLEMWSAGQEVLICCLVAIKSHPQMLTKNYPRIQSKLKLASLAVSKRYESSP